MTHAHTRTPHLRNKQDMVVRGAPAIGCAGALAMAVDLVANKGGGAGFSSTQEALEYTQATLAYISTRWGGWGVCRCGQVRMNFGQWAW